MFAIMSSTATLNAGSSTRSWPQALADLAVALVAMAGSLAVIWHGGVGPLRPGSRELDSVGVVLVACSTLPLVGGRRFPLIVFVSTGAAGVLLEALGYRLDLLVGPAVALFLLAATREERSPWTWRTSAIAAGLFVAYLGASGMAQGLLPASEFLHTGLAWAVAWFAGDRTRLRREQLERLRADALRVERDAERDRLLAIAEERARIARDLHDSAGHAISLIAVRAGAARMRHREDPERSLQALRAIEEIARETAAEIDQIVGSLRNGVHTSDPVEEPSGLASLPTLVARHRDAGLEVGVD